MSADGSIAVERVWKRFHADRSRPVLRDELERLRTRRSHEQTSRWRFVLRDVSLAIDPGEAVGLFGVNGSGKSTLLKLLTRVMYPYAGRIQVNGRVGALIEIRAGIHPDLSGRENVFLYGSLLGLPRKEVARRFEAIVEFAEIADAIDRQVKFYSSGMSMRLGFGVAAFLQPDVLLVDEVMAVGDAAFQQKCLDRMREVLADGTTVVFVSHDLATIEAICDRGIWLHDGEIRVDAPIEAALGEYRGAIEHEAEVHATSAGDAGFDLVMIDGAGVGRAATRGPLRAELGFRGRLRGRVRVDLGVTQGTAAPIFTTSRALDLRGEPTTFEVAVDSLPLPGGRYYLWAAVTDEAGHSLVQWQPLNHFDVDGPPPEPAPRGVLRLSPVYVPAVWHGAAVVDDGTDLAQK